LGGRSLALHQNAATAGGTTKSGIYFRRRMKQDNKRYKQFAGFPGHQGAVAEVKHGPKPVPPLTDAERAEMGRLGIPHEPEPPREYTPPAGPYTRRMGIEWLGPLGLAAVVLTLLGWLLSVPASGESSYYKQLIEGRVTKIEAKHGHGGHADEHHGDEQHAAEDHGH
jgi:hypothetical protein